MSVYTTASRMEALQHYEQVCHCCGEQYKRFLVVAPVQPEPDTTDEQLKTLWSQLMELGWPQEGFTVYCRNCLYALGVGRCNRQHSMGGFGGGQLARTVLFTPEQAISVNGPMVERLRRRFKGYTTELTRSLKHQHRSDNHDPRETLQILKELMRTIREWKELEGSM